MRNTFYGTIKDGKLVFDHAHMVKEVIACCRDMRVVVTIKKEGADPSLEQWKYLYAGVYKIFGDTYGWTIEDVDVYSTSHGRWSCVPRFNHSDKIIKSIGLNNNLPFINNYGVHDNLYSTQGISSYEHG